MDANELIGLLESDPHARDAARRLILTDDLLALPDLVRENSRQIGENGRQIAENTAAIAELREAVAKNTEAIAELREAVAELRESVEALASGLGAARADILDLKGELRGMRLERRYRNHPYGYFGSLVRRARTLSQQELSAILGDAVDSGRLSLDETRDLAQADLVVVGTADGQPAYLVIEVSVTIGTSDVTRAAARAALLTRTGLPARGVAAGGSVSGQVTDEAIRARVAVVLDGREVA